MWVKTPEIANKVHACTHRYTGDLSITLINGPTILIPSDQLVMPHMEINGPSGEITANNTEPDLLVDSLQDVSRDDITHIGVQFFTSAYLHVNYDTNTFSLWEANPTSRESIVAVDEHGTETSTFCAASSVSSTTGAPIPTKSTHIAAGTIAGATVGAVVGCAGLAFLCIFLCRKKKQSKPTKEQPSVTQEQDQLTNMEATYKPSVQPPPFEVLYDESVQLSPRHELHE